MLAGGSEGLTLLVLLGNLHESLVSSHWLSRGGTAMQSVT